MQVGERGLDAERLYPPLPTHRADFKKATSLMFFERSNDDVAILPLVEMVGVSEGALVSTRRDARVVGFTFSLDSGFKVGVARPISREPRGPSEREDCEVRGPHPRRHRKPDVDASTARP